MKTPGKLLLSKLFRNCAAPKGAAGRLLLHIMNRGHRGVYRWTFDQCPFAAGMRVLDVGCGMGALAEEAEKKGATLVGQWSAEGYTHTASAAQRGDKFVGLALDEMNEADKTADRIAAWTAQVQAEAGI